MNWLIDIIKSIDKLPVRVILWVIVTTGFLILSPLLPFRYPIEFSNLLTTYKGILLFIFIGSLLWLFIQATYSINQIRRNTVSENEVKESIINSIKTLDDKEKSFLREFFIRKQNTIDLPIDDPIIAGMIKNKILIRVGNISTVRLCFPVSMHSIACSYINKNRVVVGYPENEPTEEELKKLEKERPDLSHPMQKCL